MPSKRCDICNKFCEELNTRRYKHRWKCNKCNLYYVVRYEGPIGYNESKTYYINVNE